MAGWDEREDERSGAKHDLRLSWVATEDLGRLYLDS